MYNVFKGSLNKKELNISEVDSMQISGQAAGSASEFDFTGDAPARDGWWDLGDL